MAIFEGHLHVRKGDRFALVCARWNDFIVERLVLGAQDCIVRHGGSLEQVDVIKVPGSFELPLAAKWAAESGKYAGVCVLGTVIRGGTPHFDMIAAEVTKGTAAVSLESGVPVAFGVDLAQPAHLLKPLRGRPVLEVRRHHAHEAGRRGNHHCPANRRERIGKCDGAE